MPWTKFDYLYRDASNHKAHGCIAFEGTFSDEQSQRIVSRFHDGNLFVAEQIDVPVLYGQLYRWSGGATWDDHCWHEWDGFEHFDDEKPPPNVFVWGSTTDFLCRIEKVECWNGGLSPHFNLGDPMISITLLSD